MQGTSCESELLSLVLRWSVIRLNTFSRATKHALFVTNAREAEEIVQPSTAIQVLLRSEARTHMQAA